MDIYIYIYVEHLLELRKSFLPIEKIFVQTGKNRGYSPSGKGLINGP